MMSRIIYCFWFGNKMSDNRLRCFDSILKNSKVSVQLITEDNLLNFIKQPLHSGFQYLSSTHKADYLRPYIMYYYGGGYTDVKFCEFDWNHYFDLLENSNKSFIACTHVSQKEVAYNPSKHIYNKIPGCTPFIFKEKTLFAKTWLSETNNKMDLIFKNLIKYPGTYHPRAVTGGVQGEPEMFTDSQYPLSWNELLGQIFHKVAFENLDEFLLEMPRPKMENYR